MTNGTWMAMKIGILKHSPPPGFSGSTNVLSMPFNLFIYITSDR